MKKFFFFAAAMMVSAAAMAANEVYTPSQTDYPTEAEAKAGTDKTSVEAGASLYAGTAFDVKNAFATTYQRVGLAANSYNTLQMGGQDIVVADQWGIQGNDNPKDAEGKNVDGTHKTPTQGAVFQIDVKQDGFIYVFHKASSNKVYTVFEVYNGEATAMGYDFSMITCPAGKKNDGGKVAWLKDVEVSPLISDSLITYSPEVDGDNYVTKNIVFPEIDMLGTYGEYGDIKDSALVQKNGAYCQNGLGVIAFPVEEGTSYYVNACGSKMSLAAVAFTTEAGVNVTVSNGTETKTLFAGFTTTALENTEAAAVATKVIENGHIYIIKNGVRYNVLGAKL